MEYREVKSDILIIGSGAAGLRTAIELHKLGIDCLVLGKCKLGNAHTTQATGGINAALGNLDPKDNWRLHAADTLREGQFLSNQKTIELLCKDAPRAIQDLEKYGMNFHREKNGKITQRFFGAALYRRACFYGDQTGRELIRSLVEETKKRKISFHDYVYITKLLKNKARVIGAFGVDLKNGKFYLFKSKSVVLAMGGYSRVYKRSSSRLFENTGDGVSLAYDAGAELQDMELVQFHPTGMVYPKEAEGILVTESVRGEGGQLFNSKQERFMSKYDPVRMELGSRDEVARAIYDEINKGKGTLHNGVWLDISHKPKNYILDRLPKMYKQFKKYLNLDISKQKMEVAPTSHYTMGGIKVKFPTMETSIKGLFAVGEVTAGTHGANRLGGNSLLECIVFGKYAGRYAAKYSNKKFIEPNVEDVNTEINRLNSLINGKDNNPIKLSSELNTIMWKYAGISRNRKDLELGLKKVLILKGKILKAQVKNEFKNNENFAILLNLRNMLVPCEAIFRGALKRKESRGAHFRTDFIKENNKYLGNYIYFKKGDKMNLTFSKLPRITSKMLTYLKMVDKSLRHHLE
jgi:succinate dehydrogenase / fumarate reductase, flavoprotein subunit